MEYNLFFITGLRARPTVGLSTSSRFLLAVFIVFLKSVLALAKKRQEF